MAESPRCHKCWLLHRAHPCPTSATKLPVLSCHQEVREGMEEGSEPAGTGLSAFCQGKVAAGRGAEGLWQGLVLMAGTHRVFRLGTEPQQHTGEPRGSSAAPGESQGKEHRGQEVAEPPHHLRQAQGTQQVLTAAGAASSGRWEWGRREGRARGERGDTVTAQGELLPLREQKQAGTVQASPAESHQTPRATKHPPHPATPPFHPGTATQDGL